MKRDSYGYEINKAVREATGGAYELKEASLYQAFRRLESSQCIVAYWGEEHTTARRRYYKITPTGVSVYQQNKADWETVKTLIDQLLV